MIGSEPGQVGTIFSDYAAQLFSKPGNRRIGSRQQRPIGLRAVAHRLIQKPARPGMQAAKQISQRRQINFCRREIDHFDEVPVTLKPFGAQIANGPPSQGSIGPDQRCITALQPRLKLFRSALDLPQPEQMPQPADCMANVASGAKPIEQSHRCLGLTELIKRRSAVKAQCRSLAQLPDRTVGCSKGSSWFLGLEEQPDCQEVKFARARVGRQRAIDARQRVFRLAQHRRKLGILAVALVPARVGRQPDLEIGKCAGTIALGKAG